MKTEEQIKDMLTESLKSLVEIQEWEKKARESYRLKVTAFGGADMGELYEASSQVSYCKGEIEALKWALS